MLSGCSAYLGTKHLLAFWESGISVIAIVCWDHGPYTNHNPELRISDGFLWPEKTQVTLCFPSGGENALCCLSHSGTMWQTDTWIPPHPVCAFLPYWSVYPCYATIIDEQSHNYHYMLSPMDPSRKTTKYVGGLWDPKTVPLSQKSTIWISIDTLVFLKVANQ